MSIPSQSAVDLHRASFSDDLCEVNDDDKKASYEFLDRLESERTQRIKESVREIKELQALLN